MGKIKFLALPLSCRREMTNHDIIKQILARNLDVKEEQILEKLQVEKSRTGGLLSDETLLRLIAAKYGVEVQQKAIRNDGNLSIGCLFAGLNNVTVAGRLIAIYPSRTFQGEKPGKFATLMLVDNDGVLRVVLWNEKADLVEKGDLKVGQGVRLVHGYTREDRYGKIELHLGGKSQIEVLPEGKAMEYPLIDKFNSKIGSLGKMSGNVHLFGTVREILGLSTFARSDLSEGAVMRLILADDSGAVTVVIWNEKAMELEKNLRTNALLQLVNAKVKETQNGGLEVHVDSNTFVTVQATKMQMTKIACLTENQTVNVEGVVSKVLECKEVATSKGEIVRLIVFDLKDDSGTVCVSAWREQTEALNGLKVGDKLVLENVCVKKAFGNKLELSTRSATVSSIMPP